MLIRGIRNIPSHLKSPDYKRDYNKASGWPETTRAGLCYFVVSGQPLALL